MESIYRNATKCYFCSSFVFIFLLLFVFRTLCFFTLLQNGKAKTYNPHPTYLLIHTFHLRNRPTPLILRHPHVRINRGRERRETRTSHEDSLRTCIPRENAACKTSTSYAVIKIVFRAQALDGAFCAGEDGADFGEVAA